MAGSMERLLAGDAIGGNRVISYLLQQTVRLRTRRTSEIFV
jgi:hypothetical protein